MLTGALWSLETYILYTHNTIGALNNNTGLVELFFELSSVYVSII